MWQSILGMLGNMGGAGGAAGGAAGGGASLMKGLGAAADYYNNAGKPQQQIQGMSLQDALIKQKQFKDNQTMQKMAAYQPMDTTAPDLGGITSMRY